MNYLIIGALVTGTLFGFTVAIVQIQSVAADYVDYNSICYYIVGGCIPDPTNKTNWIPLLPHGYGFMGKGSGMSELLDWDKILNLPENQTFSISVKHGPTVDTVVIQIPKALSSPAVPNMWTPKNMTMQNTTRK